MVPPPGNTGFELVMTPKPKVQAGRAIWGVTTAQLNGDLVAGPNRAAVIGITNLWIAISHNTSIPGYASGVKARRCGGS
jgi:hypothetical protein